MQSAVLLVALLTPFTRQGNVDVEALGAHVGELRSAGIDGFFVCGTTGEGPLLDDDEVELVTRTVVGESPAGYRVIAQVGRPSTRATLRLLGKAFDSGASGVTVVTPYYYELDSTRIEEHYRELLAAANHRPLYAYVIPRRTGNDLSPELVKRLAMAGLAGVKDSTRSLDRHIEYLQVAAGTPARFEVYMGTDGLALDALQRGSTGIVSAIANLRPELFVGLRDAMRAGSPEDAAKYQSEIISLRQSLQQGDTIGNLKAGVRQRLESRGLAYPAALRPPLGTAGA
ncbi:MAG TPA: dihydrodipicolinate synthase family protein [Terriglobales bacterium]|jgi:4-hydroxy-tetrahydrodipicolinate synthase/2-dehydro-3-deoxy-phosphogluconate/2-dehydro-3-deoxy-6-phosphogalactonate aldolase